MNAVKVDFVLAVMPDSAVFRWAVLPSFIVENADRSNSCSLSLWHYSFDA